MATSQLTPEDVANCFIAGWRISSEFIGASRWRCRVTPIEGKPHAYHVVVTERNEKGQYEPTQYWIDVTFGTVLPAKIVASIGRNAFTSFSNAWFEKQMADWGGLGKKEDGQ